MHSFIGCVGILSFSGRKGNENEEKTGGVHNLCLVSIYKHVGTYTSIHASVFVC